MYNKFKFLLEDDTFFYGMIIVLVALSSFGLGRWSQVEQGIGLATVPVITSQSANIPMSIKEEGVPTSSPVDMVVTGQYVASKSGTKYHLLTCSGAKQIKEENKIFFDSKEAAQKAGYTPAANCKGI